MGCNERIYVLGTDTLAFSKKIVKDGFDVSNSKAKVSHSFDGYTFQFLGRFRFGFQYVAQFQYVKLEMKLIN